MSHFDREPASPTSLREYFSSWSNAWNRFWFDQRDPKVLGLIRIMVGSIVFYTHLVWTKELNTFLGADGLLPSEYRELLFGNSFAWSHLDWFGSSGLLMGVHLAGLVIVLLFTAGVWTRWTGILTALLVISYANRGTGALFGLDQINAFLCLYLAIGNAGGAWSIDLWRVKKHNRTTSGEEQGGRSQIHPAVLNCIATRLIQIHLCVVYAFAAIGKLQGETWYTGEAIWRAFASREYQTLDMTWMADHMWLVALITLASLTWELVYPALIWPRLTRPVMLAIAVLIHLGIGLCMGMMSFGLIMIAANLAFIEPESLKFWIKRLKR